MVSYYLRKHFKLYIVVGYVAKWLHLYFVLSIHYCILFYYHFKLVNHNYYIGVGSIIVGYNEYCRAVLEKLLKDNSRILMASSGPVGCLCSTSVEMLL